MNQEAEYFDRVVRSRRSIRVFDQTKSYDPDVVKRSLERAILSPNSSNMQLWEFYRIRSEEAKKQVAYFCQNQHTATTAAELVVFVARPDKVKQSIQLNLDLVNDPNSFEKQSHRARRRKYYTTSMRLFYARDFLFMFSIIKKLISFFIGLKRPMVREVTTINKKVTIHKSIALAAQTFMLSVRAEAYDTCPMEGFDSKRLKKYLNLPRQAEINMVISVGQRAEGGIWYPQVRYPYDEVVFEK